MSETKNPSVEDIEAAEEFLSDPRSAQGDSRLLAQLFATARAEGERKGLEGHRAERGRRCCPCYERANAAEAELHRAEQRGREEVKGALRKMVDAVCGETGFANAVRLDSGKAYPWPALDIAERIAALILEGEKP